MHSTSHVRDGQYALIPPASSSFSIAPALPAIPKMPEAQNHVIKRRVRVLVLNSSDASVAQEAAAKRTRVLEKINFIPIANRDPPSANDAELDRIVNSCKM